MSCKILSTKTVIIIKAKKNIKRINKKINMPQIDIKVTPTGAIKKRGTNKFISQIFGTHLNFSNYTTAHPIIQMFLFGKNNSEQLAELKQEIKWILQADEELDEELIANFLVALDGLKNTVNYYEVCSFSEVISVLKAEKRVFRSVFKTLE